MIETMKLSRSAKRQLKLDRLCSAMRKARLVLKPYRENRKRMLRMFAGADWSENAADLRRPLNVIGMYVQIISRALISQTPRAMLSTWDKKYIREVWTAQEWGNKQAEKINLGEHLHRWVLDALFWFGIMKVGITTPIDAERVGWKNFAGEAYAECIDPDDYVCDVFARNFDELSFEGHRYRAGVEAANRLFALRGEDRFDHGTPSQYNQDGDERVGLIGRGYVGGDTDEFGELVDLWEVYVPAHKAILTFRSSDGGTPAGKDDLLLAQEYFGPHCGQYTKLGYITIPGQLLPKGPVMDQIQLDNAINNMARKLIRQAERCKSVGLYAQGKDEDAARINDAYDGQTVRGDPTAIQEIVLGQPNSQIFGLMLQFKQLHSQLCGNLEVLGGLARQAGTASQENLLSQNASGMLAHMQSMTVKGTQRVFDALHWYWWHDPQGSMRAKYTLDADSSVEMPRELTAEERRQIDWYDIDHKVDPYSLAADSPQSRIQHIRQLVNQASALMPILGQQGVQFDARYWLRKEGEYANNPDVRDLFKLGEPAPGDSPKEEGTGKPPITERTYKRTSESEATEGGAERDMIQKMMGAGANGAGDFGGMME